MNRSSLETMFSSNTCEWPTPLRFFNALDRRFGPFTLDPCADPVNAKCTKFFTKEQDGLTQSWAGHKVFVNPPYGRVMPGWIEKSYMESLDSGTSVVMLIPARTDTRYWHDFVMRSDEIHLVRGRLKFGKSSNSAPFPSAVVVFRGRLKGKSSPALFTMRRDKGILARRG